MAWAPSKKVCNSSVFFNSFKIHDGFHCFIMNRNPDFVTLDSFYIVIRDGFQAHFTLKKAGAICSLLYIYQSIIMIS